MFIIFTISHSSLVFMMIAIMKTRAPLLLQGAAEKSGPLNVFAIFSATVWDFNMKFYVFI